MIATDQGEAEVVKTLVRRNAQVNNRDSDGETALSIAARNGRTDIVEILVIEGRAAIDHKDNRKMTPVMKAAFHGRLVEMGAKLNLMNINGQTALMIAKAKGYDTIVNILGAPTFLDASENGQTKFRLDIEAK